MARAGKASGIEERVGPVLKRQVLPSRRCNRRSFPKYYGKAGGVEDSTAPCSLAFLGG